jgi:hypothetical protein
MSKLASERFSKIGARSVSFLSRMSSLNSLTSKQTSDPAKKDRIVSDEITDESRLYNAVREAGRYADGIDAVEVWMIKDLHLVQPEGG